MQYPDPPDEAHVSPEALPVRQHDHPQPILHPRLRFRAISRAVLSFRPGILPPPCPRQCRDGLPLQNWRALPEAPLNSEATDA